MANLCTRLKEERTRLGYNQTEFAKLGGVSKRSQVNYEAGERSPDADYLLAIADIGADITYVLTGENLCDMAMKQLGKTERIKAALNRVLDVQEQLGMEFTEEQIKALMGFTVQHCPTKAQLATFVSAALELAELSSASESP